MENVLNKVVNGKQSFILEDKLDNLSENRSNIPYDVKEYNIQEAYEKEHNECIPENGPLRKKHKSKSESGTKILETLLIDNIILSK